MPKRITMKEIARLAGVDRTSVSRILNEDFVRHSYRQETVDKVKAIAEEHGYTPHRAASALKTGKTQLIGLLMSNIRNPFFGDIASRIDSLLSDMDYRVLIADSANSFAREAKALRDLAAFSVDGIIFAPSTLKEQPSVKGMRTPIVVLDYNLYPDRPSILLDYDDAANKLLNLFTSRGRSKIGLVCHSATCVAEACFAKAANPPITIHLPPQKMRAIPTIYDQVRYLVAKGVDGLICLNNEITIRSLHCLKDDGVVIPDQVAVAGIDEIPMSGLVPPPMTVIRQPIVDYARTAVDYLQQMIADPETVPPSRRFEGTLIIRESV
jgi:LacI family transcriptional regulator, galactose operon repressor